MINNKKYYLNDTNLADPNVGGVCVLNCTGAFYEGDTDFECLPCNDGCAECDYSPSNCTKCKTSSINVKYFLQPNENKCMANSCPSKYFKS